jgi:hypothetical protein
MVGQHPLTCQLRLAYDTCMTAKQSKADRAIDLISQIEEDTRKTTIAELASDLTDFLRVASADEVKGMRAAIEILRTNY